MNILYHFRTRGSGAEAVHIAGISRGLEKLGHCVFFSSPTGVDPRRTAGATPFAPAAGGVLARLLAMLPRGFFELLEVLYNVPAFARNLRLARKHGCEVIYERHAFFLCSTAWVARWRGCKLVVEVNELVGDPRVRAQPMLAPLARWSDHILFNRADLVVVVSPHLKRRVLAHGVAAHRILVLPNAVSEEELKIPEPLPAGERPFPEAIFILGFVGWLVEWHRLDFVIDALATPEFANVGLMLVGEGPLQAALEKQARQSGVRVAFMGPRPHGEIPAWIRAMDACVVPHSNEYRSPIKLFEFMAQGRPVLAPNTEPIRSIINPGANGLLFEPLDKAEFQHQLRALTGSEALRKSLGSNARAAIEAHHTWARNAAAVVNQLTQS